MKLKLFLFIILICFNFWLRIPTVYITEEYGGPLEFPDDTGNFPGLFEINQDRSYQVEEERDSTSDFIAAMETPRPQPQTQSTIAFRRFSLPVWVVFYLLFNGSFLLRGYSKWLIS